MAADRRPTWPPTLAEALGVAAAVVAVLGGVVVWHAIGRLDHAWRGLTVVDDRTAAVDATIDARIEQAVGTVGLDTARLTPAGAARGQLHADLVALAETGGLGRARATDVERLADAAVAGAKAHRTANEQDVFALVEAKDSLTGRALQVAGDDVDAARGTARLTVAVVAGVAAALAAGAALAARWSA